MKHALGATALALALGFALPAMADSISVSLSPGVVVSGNGTSAAINLGEGDWIAVSPALPASIGSPAVPVQQGMATQLILKAALSQGATIFVGNGSVSPCMNGSADQGLNPAGFCRNIEGVR